MQIQVSEILKDAFAHCRSDGDFDRCLKDAVRRAHGETPHVLEAVVRMLDGHAQQEGIARIEAARRMAAGTASVNSMRFGSVDEMPPEIRARFEQMKREGRTSDTVTRVQRFTPDQLTPEMKGEAVRQMREHARRTRRPGTLTLILDRPWKKALAYLALAALLCLPLLPGILRLMKQAKAPGRFEVKKAVDQLEKQHAADTDDIDKALRLAEGYARQIVVSRTLKGLREHNPVDAAADPGLAKRWEQNLARYETITGVKGTLEEKVNATFKGETLARKLLLRDDLNDAQRMTAHVLLGHFLLAGDRYDEALAASAAAEAFDKVDPRPDILNAHIHEAREAWDEAIAANHAALSKLGPYANRSPGMLREMMWCVGYTRVTDEIQWRKHQKQIADNLRQGIEMHLLTLKALKTVVERDAKAG